MAANNPLPLAFDSAKAIDPSQVFADAIQGAAALKDLEARMAALRRTYEIASACQAVLLMEAAFDGIPELASLNVRIYHEDGDGPRRFVIRGEIGHMDIPEEHRNQYAPGQGMDLGTYIGVAMYRHANACGGPNEFKGKPKPELRRKAAEEAGRRKGMVELAGGAVGEASTLAKKAGEILSASPELQTSLGLRIGRADAARIALAFGSVELSMALEVRSLSKAAGPGLPGPKGKRI